jgi:hypothetical protein
MNIKTFVLLIAVFTTGAANAIPVKFNYTGSITNVNGAALQGLISVGDTATIEVIADNGSSSLLSQTWDVFDTITATFSAGSYVLTHSDDWWPGGNGFVTDGTGNLILSQWYGISIDLTAFDSFGAGGDLNNGTGYASNGDFFGYGPDLGTVSSWSDPTFVTNVPEPATLALMGLGLAGLGFSRRKKA